MKNEDIILKTSEYVKKELLNEGSGHDWWHIFRVWNNAKLICKTERANIFIVELAALLHDIADWKFNNGDQKAGSKKAKIWLESLYVDPQIILKVCEIIETSSFKGAKVQTSMKTIEGKIVQDADRLDAIGAIGIGRSFTYGGHIGRLMHNPEIKPYIHKTAEEYIEISESTINHFYEKLLLLKDLMNTETAKKIAQKKHEFMQEFLTQFYKEWNGEL
ncbi:MAG: HD domain-containing protein [bacterium]|nr:HD domain-containing protein [bacterium]